jgi:hypothetical protein
VREEQAPNGSYEWVPEGAIILYPIEVVQRLFGHANKGSTRKAMSRWDIPAETGYWVDDVHWALEQRQEPWTGYSRRKGDRKPPARVVHYK